MGQKINPLGFRLGTTQSHHSLWFAQAKNYPAGLQEDQKIRNFVKKYVQKNIPETAGTLGLARIEIHKRIDMLRVIMFIGFPNLVIGNKPLNIQEFQRNLQKEFLNEFHYIRQKLHYVKLTIAIKKIAQPYGNPNIIAEFIAEQLKNRIPFRKAIKKAIELTQKAGTKGMQVQISGRIGGKEIARVEWVREGRVPLQTIRAKIGYCSYTARTIYGVLGIKIWIFK
nr:ribosomal protein S3 [Plantago coronopus]QWL16083.1 ribosomal protein S3 [Plantago macrorhiza]